MNRIKIVGIGPGHKDYILPIAYKTIEEADLLIGGSRNLEVFQDYKKETLCYEGNLKEIVETMAIQKENNKKIVVLVSGDTGFYSLLDYIKNFFSDEDIEVIPGISSFQYLFSRLKRSYKGYGLYSLHGRDIQVDAYIEKHQGVFLLTDEKNTPSSIVTSIMDAYGHWKMIVGENLSYENEKITQGKVKDFRKKEFSKLCVVVIEKYVE
ncbi:precorrin-6Y C5,15-methyltransferase (decarboxylating) [Natranaerovirga pectinivora]|uniref:Precorrin-6Y C5,15-methyltransferase (Decarboxylating) n=1 Tax=Natranaerovirga pectinivora TaxID=682400 RepID=A0A4R3MJX5_9FIRM|nr:precorrin-6y C5,15-methyltransferase (decarboxylating) subunit CbiE [Natranaerovirga pectinivora]TCT13797.1 precorrin-6Y C5,15-methyltransferase (decarboxylating) [Natranaerovirga pectinivora]